MTTTPTNNKAHLIDAYYEISIQRHHGGFGMYELGETDYSPSGSYAMLDDLEHAMYEGNQGLMMRLEEALRNAEFLAAGIVNIRGRIYGGDPSIIFALLCDGTIDYCGIEMAEVDSDHWQCKTGRR